MCHCKIVQKKMKVSNFCPTYVQPVQPFLHPNKKRWTVGQKGWTKVGIFDQPVNNCKSIIYKEGCQKVGHGSFN